jgi:hypothetical protein
MPLNATLQFEHDILLARPQRRDDQENEESSAVLAPLYGAGHWQRGGRCRRLLQFHR